MIVRSLLPCSVLCLAVLCLAGLDLVGSSGGDARTISRGSLDRESGDEVSLRLRLRPEASVERRFIALEDLVEVVEDRGDVFQALDHTIVRIPAGGVVGRADLESRLVRAGLSERRFKIEGAARCRCQITKAQPSKERGAS